MHTGGTQAFAQPPRRGHFQHTLSGRAILPALLSVFTGTASFAATLQLSLRGPILFCLARKEWGEKRRWRRVILRAHARDFLAAPRGLNALFGRRIATIPMAFGSGKCTTRICGQTASTSVLLISGILGQSHSRTAYCRGGRLCPPCLSFTYVCRGRWRAQPSATKERYGCGPPLAGAHRPSFPICTGLPLIRQHCNCRSAGPFFSVLPEKNGEKRGAGAALYCALTRAIFWPLRGLNALFGRRIATIPMAFGSGKCTTRICGQTASTSVLLISGILGRLRCCTACCRGRCAHRPCKYWAPPANTQMACHFHGSVFCHFLARQLLSMRALSPRRWRCSIVL